MTDLWTLLLQTLTASSAAALLLLLKALFRDKLSPRWQFGVWGVLGLVLLCPAGLGGRWSLVPWARWVEAARTAFTGEYGALAQVTAPIPLPNLALPQSPEAWLYAVYVLGVLFFLLRYVWSCLLLRRALAQLRPQENPVVQQTAERFGLPSCPAVEVPGLSSAFVCGVFRPVLALPAEGVQDETILLHELLHLKYHDAAWGLVICCLRCLHWCNPLLWFCCGLARNDLETLCDHRVLERLEGEQRREYGRVLLSMAEQRYACFPGTSSIANGRRNIRRRIEAIVRFKKYPAGMDLVSLCIVLVIGVPLLAGHPSDASQIADLKPSRSIAWDLACARTTYCTTSDGALDTYAKAVLAQNSKDHRLVLSYRAMCAPLEEQGDLAARWQEMQQGDLPTWKALSGVPYSFYNGSDYVLYNLTPTEDGGYQGLLALHLLDSPDGDGSTRWYAYQRLRTEREGPRWVVRPLEAFWLSKTPAPRLLWDEGEVRLTHQGEGEGFQVRVWTQTESWMDTQPASWWMVDAVPPETQGQFIHQYGSGIEFRFQEEVPQGTVAFSCAPWAPGTQRPALRRPAPQGGSASREGEVSYSFGPDETEAIYFDPAHRDETSLWFYWGTFGDHSSEALPIALDLYLDGQRQGQLTLQPTGP